MGGGQIIFSKNGGSVDAFDHFLGGQYFKWNNFGVSGDKFG